MSQSSKPKFSINDGNEAAASSTGAVWHLEFC
jgi:hypothetical protein